MQAPVSAPSSVASSSAQARALSRIERIDLMTKGPGAQAFAGEQFVGRIVELAGLHLLLLGTHAE